MTNDYYNPAGNISANTRALSSEVIAELNAIQAGFAKLPSEATLTGNGIAYAADTGVADAYVVALAPVPASYTTGMAVRMSTSNANTGASTINVNGLGAKAIKTATGSALVGGEIIAGAIIEMFYDGTDFRLNAATTPIETAGIQDAAVTAAKLATDAVTNAKIAANAIGTAEIVDGAATTAKLAADAVTGAKIADDAIDSEHIAAGAIDQEHIASAQIAGWQMVDETITGSKIQDGTITAVELASNAVTTAKITDRNVTTNKIALNAVTAAEIAVGTITGTQIQDGTIAAADLASNAVTTAKIADANVTAAKLATDAITTAKVADDAITESKLAADFFRWQKESGELSVAFDSAAATFTHSLARVPILVQVVLRCKTAEHGYAIGDEIFFTDVSGSGDQNFTVKANSTTVTIITGNSIQVHDSSFNRAAISVARWRWIIRCT